MLSLNQKKMLKVWEVIKVSSPMFILAFLVGIIGYGVLDLMFPVQHTNPFKGFTWNGIGMFVAIFVAICVGVSWLFNGVGFLLVKVK